MIALSPPPAGASLQRRWTVLLPVIFISYSLSYLDRANFSFGAAAGMASDLHISASQNSLLGSLFFLGYFLFQIPGAAYAQKYSVKRLIFFGLIGWGVLASATGLITDIHLLYFDRFLLGVVESAVLPAMLILQARWYTRAERARANAFLVLGNPATMLWMSLLSGYLAAQLGWRTMFVIEGVPPILWALIWWWQVADHPRDAAWLLPADRQTLEDKLAREQQAIAPVANYAAAFRTPRVILLAAQYFLWSIGVYGFVIWLPSILRTRDMGLVELGWLSAVPYLAAVIAEIVTSTYSDLIQKRLSVTWPCLALAAAAFYGSFLLGATHFWASFVLLTVAGAMMYAPYGPFFAHIAETLPRNVVGGAIALINSMGALGSFVGAYGVGMLNGMTGSPGASYLMMAAALIVSAAITFALGKGATSSLQGFPSAGNP
ncbi:MAG TPA: MFS transporter [Rhizomicrobium sp.]|nr:MFS transporter [Rhizomicrobium sp.]